MPDFYIVSSFFYKKAKHARVPNFVWLFIDDATTAKCPGCDEGTNLRLRDFAVVPLVPTRRLALVADRGITVRVDLFVLLLYVPSQFLWSWRDGQFTLPHFFLGKLKQAVNQYFVNILSLVTDNCESGGLIQNYMTRYILIRFVVLDTI